MTSAIINKIEKVLSLANSDNVHEAANALAKARSIAEKYNIGLELLQGSKFRHEEKIIIFSQEYGEPFKVSLQDWEMILARVIADNNDCKVWIYTLDDGGDALDIIGMTVDVEISDRMFLWLRTQLLGLMFRETGTVKHEAFALGAIHRVNQRLEEASRQARGEVSNVPGYAYAIQKLDMKKLNVLSAFNDIKTVNLPNKQLSDKQNWMNGFQKAETIQLHDRKLAT